MSSNTRSGAPNPSPSTRRSAAANAAATTGAAADDSAQPLQSSSTASQPPPPSSNFRTRSDANDRRSGPGSGPGPGQSGGPGGSLNASDCEALAARLVDPSSDVKAKFAAVMELKEGIEQSRELDWVRYLAILVPAFIEVFHKGKPAFYKDSPENKLRHTMLEIIHRFPQNETIRPYVSDLASQVLLYLLRTDNEEMGVLSVKIYIEFNRLMPTLFRSELEKHVKTFLELVREAYQNVPALVRQEFGVEGEELPPPSSATPDAPKMLRPALKSFKVITESPVAVVLIFQCFKDQLLPEMREFFPMVLEQCLQLQAEPQRRAHAQANARGELWVGVAEGIRDKDVYLEFVNAQVKTMSFFAYIFKIALTEFKSLAENLAESCIRIIRDCPAEAVGPRKEMLIATRHILTSELKSCFLPHIDVMLDERILLGTSATSQEALRPLAYSLVSDLIHHMRDKLTTTQIARVIDVYLVCMHDPVISMAVQTMCAKLVINFVDIICAKFGKSESPRFIYVLLEACIDKLQAIEAIYGRMALVYGKQAEGKGKPEWLLIEKAKSVHAVAYAASGTEAFDRELHFLPEARHLVKTLLHGIRGLFQHLRVLNAQLPDGALLGRLFEAQARLVSHYDLPRHVVEEKEALELFHHTLLQYDPHVFAEVWTDKMDFFVEQCLLNPRLITVPQSLLVPQNPGNQHHRQQEVSHQLVSILLQYLMKRLPTFGHQDRKRASMTHKLFKLAFMAVNAFPELNEMVLVPHLAKLITDSLAYAAKADEPQVYFIVLKSLFRSIGGGRFENLYNVFLPILQEMLDKFNHLLLCGDPDKRDTYVELCLTVPVRLTNLLPHLGYLMRPLVHALRAGPELVSQALRTLELCIDNLTSEFLDKNLGPVLRDLMSALHDLLRPVPFNHHHSHATLKILGKLGGRNRRFQQVPHLLEYHPPSAQVEIPISFDGQLKTLAIGPVVALALKTITHTQEHYRAQAFQFLTSTAMLVIEQGVCGPEQEAVLHQTVQGLFHATLSPELKEQATVFLRKLSRHVFDLERNRPPPTESLRSGRDTRHGPVLPLVNCYLEGLALAMASLPLAEMSAGNALISLVVEDILSRPANAKVEGAAAPSLESQKPDFAMLDTLLTKFSALCFEEPWLRKIIGCAGLALLTAEPGISHQWIVERQLECLRPLFFILKDMPNDPPQTVVTVQDTIKRILRICNAKPDGGAPQRNRLVLLLIKELASPNADVRDTAQASIQLLSELVETPVSDLLSPVKGQLLTPIWDKPLRALSFSMQIGNLEAVTYCLNLRPSLPDINEQFLRLLHEAIALADADDHALIGRSAEHRYTVSLKNLRISCLRLLCAAMSRTECFPGQNQTPIRTRIISVYFKHVYSSTDEIMKVAYDGLSRVMAQQSKLPKEVLQGGLHPILTNLADAKKLTVSGLEGLARFLDLLTNYFKVEIGHKLLDHFRTLSEEPNLLQRAALGGVLEENTEIAKMIRLVEIVRRLPPTANMFLKDLTALVVKAETNLRQSTPGPFTENLAKYLNRFKGDAVAHIFENLRNPDVVRSFCHVIASGHAPAFVAELSSEAAKLAEVCFLDETAPDLVTPGLLLVRELVKADPKWLNLRQPVRDALLLLWRATPSRMPVIGDGAPPSAFRHEPMQIAELFLAYLENDLHVPLLFDVIRIFTLKTRSPLARVTAFFYENVASNPAADKRAILTHFLGVFGDPEVSWQLKLHALRVIVNPILVVLFSRADREPNIINAQFVASAHALIWLPLSTEDSPLSSVGDALKIELIQMCTLLVQHCSEAMSDVRKDVIKMAWLFVKDPDPTVKHTAYILIARFFEKYESPPKFIMNAWNGLLRFSPSEGRVLVRQAIDIMAKILPQIPSSGGNQPPWALVVRRILSEEGQTTPVLISLYEIITSHPDLFYESRELFVPQMVGSLARLGSSGASTPEMKKLSVDIVDLILNWEKRRKGTAGPRDDPSDAGKRASDGDLPSPKRSRVDRAGTAVSSVSNGGGWAPPPSLRENIVSYLVRLVSTSSESIAHPTQTQRAFELLKELLGPSPWSPVSIKLQFFTRTLVQLEFDVIERKNDPKDGTIKEHIVPDGNLGPISNSAEVLALIAASKPDSFFLSNITLLRELLTKSILSDRTSLHESIRPIVERMFESLPAASDESPLETDVQAFQDWAETTITEGLSKANGLKSTLFLLGCWIKSRPDKIESLFAKDLCKVLNSLAKQLISLPQPQSSIASVALEALVELIISLLEMCRPRMGDFKEGRRWILSALVQIAEKSTSVRLLRYLLDLLRDWVLVSKDGIPTGKEKAGLLLKMMAYEKKDEPLLLTEFLQLIYEIYTQPSLARSDITARLEPAFLLGTRNPDPVLRAKFMDLFDANLPPSLASRLQYVVATQNWEPLANSYWINQALDLLLGAVDAEELLLPDATFSAEVDPESLCGLMATSKVGSTIVSARRLLHLDPVTSHQVWISVFKTAWATLPKAGQSELTRHLVSLLAKEYHLNQIDMRPNVIQTLLEGVLACTPPIVLPPFVVKYCGKTFNVWHTAIELMSNSLALEPVRSDEILKDSTRDGLGELYADLCEDDLFYGLWRRRSLYAETNAALSYEQNGMWPAAQTMYETAQIKARTGVLPFTEPEYCLWEDHWILSAQKLQQWDVLTDLARAENNHDLLLECAWRLSDWGSVDRETIESTLAAVSDVATPRRKVFEAYTCLIKMQASGKQPIEKGSEFMRILDEAFQLSIRKWVSLPKIITMAHVPLLQLFQQYVELQEAALVFESLAMTNAQNLEFRVSQDLKGIFTTWRERLPNFWDDISVWSDLLAWRQHVFSAVTKVYVPLIPQGEAATYGYRGYHETAWTINRFGQVARKHQLYDVCSNALSKIYALPNIEISEAFLKLREQAMCHFQTMDKLAEGLDSISTTNLMYFAPTQKSEFLTIKGMFIAKLGHTDEANEAFVAAVQMDLGFAKAWAEWGRFNDRQFKANPTNSSLAANAVSCYLQAAGLYKNRKSRKLVVRVLWLLSLDDATTSEISRAFESYKGEMAIWYWITLVPQLLLSLSHRESRHARSILMRIAKMYPQALFYQLRTANEDFRAVKRSTHSSHLAKRATRQNAEAAAAAAASTPAAGASSTASANGSDAAAAPTPKGEGDASDSPVSGPGAAPATPAAPSIVPPSPNVATPDPPAATATAPAATQGPPNPGSIPKQPFELVEEILNILKTAGPLLSLSMEKMVDQIHTRGKSPTEEDIYRFITALLVDAMQIYIGRTEKQNEDLKVPPEARESIARFCQSLAQGHAAPKTSFEEDLLRETSLRGYIQKLQQWRDKYEAFLDRRPRKQALDQQNCYLSEFHHGKFDEVEIPGQYLQHVDNNAEFAKIARFSPVVELGRGNGFCFRRITMIGHTGSQHSFSIQLPAARHTRREDRMSQLFRTLSTVLQSRKESRKRNLSFHLPAAISLASSLRLLELDNSYVSLQEIYDGHCRERGMSKEDPILAFTDRFRTMFDPSKQTVGSAEWINLRLELMNEVEVKQVPKTILSDYMIRLMKSPSDLFLMRKQFTLQMASVTFITYVAALQQRTLPRFNISRSTGMIFMSELLPFTTKPDAPPLMHNEDPVDFRLTPNLQHFITLTGIEGILTASMVAIGRGLCQPEFDLEEELPLFLKDEVYYMQNVLQRRPLDDLGFRDLVSQNADVFANKVKIISCQFERNREKGDMPVAQAIISLINRATNRHNLARLPESWIAPF